VNPTIALSFRYAESDYVRAVRASHASRLHLKLDVTLTFVLAGIGIYCWYLVSPHWVGALFLVVSVGFAILLIAAFTVIPSFVFRHEPKFRDEYSLTFSPEGIHFKTAHIDSQLQWSLYSRALIDSHSYLLYHGVRQFTVIPKRVFESAEQQQAFEQLLVQHVPEITRRDN
jgi:hypothetical protein